MSRSRVLFKDFTVIKLLLSAGTLGLGGFIAPFLEIDPAAVLQAKRTARAIRHVDVPKSFSSRVCLVLRLLVGFATLRCWVLVV